MSVKVMEAEGLDKEDFMGKSDPLVEIWTQHSAVETTVSQPSRVVAGIKRSM